VRRESVLCNLCMCLILHFTQQSCNVLFASKCVMRLYRLLCVHPCRWNWLRLPSCQCMCSALLQKACRQVEEKWFIVRLTLCSLFYNSLTSSWTTVDTLLEPMFWFVNHFIHYLGPVSYDFVLMSRNVQCFNIKLSCLHVVIKNMIIIAVQKLELQLVFKKADRTDSVISHHLDQLFQYLIQ